MIDKKELRVGNLVRTTTDKIFFTIRDGEDIDDLAKYDTYEPIPLTPEILEQCGFERLRYEDFPDQVLYQFDDGFILSPHDNEWFLSDHSITKMRTFKYLHELQNLYHALTSEELNFKPQTQIKT